MCRSLLRLAALGAVLCSSHASVALPGAGGEELPAVGTAGGPPRALSWREAGSWLAGRELFRREHEEKDGLGAPGFNAQSCASCHKEPVLGGAGGPEVDVLSMPGGSHYDPGKGHGNRLARMHTLRETMAAHGESLVGVFDVRQTPSLLGLGLIDAIPDEEILRNEDPEDANRDGVKGIASRLTVGQRTEIGRFGWKAEVPRLADFTCRALGGELGLTAPDQGRGFGLAVDSDRVQDPEMSQEALDDLAFFVASLAAPGRNDEGDAALVSRGERLFERVGCAVCHVPVLYGDEGPVELYSDLLLHEIQEEIVMKDSSIQVRHFRRTRENAEANKGADRLFRTPPLWGVGRTAPYLHDGSAKTLAEAVLAHDLEAAWARATYERLAAEDQQALVAFLSSL